MEDGRCLLDVINDDAALDDFLSKEPNLSDAVSRPNGAPLTTLPVFSGSKNGSQLSGTTQFLTGSPQVVFQQVVQQTGSPVVQSSSLQYQTFSPQGVSNVQRTVSPAVRSSPLLLPKTKTKASPQIIASQNNAGGQNVQFLPTTIFAQGTQDGQTPVQIQASTGSLQTLDASGNLMQIPSVVNKSNSRPQMVQIPSVVNQAGAIHTTSSPLQIGAAHQMSVQQIPNVRYTGSNSTTGQQPSATTNLPLSVQSIANVNSQQNVTANFPLTIPNNGSVNSIGNNNLVNIGAGIQPNLGVLSKGGATLTGAQGTVNVLANIHGVAQPVTLQGTVIQTSTGSKILIQGNQIPGQTLNVAGLQQLSVPGQTQNVTQGTVSSSSSGTHGQQFSQIAIRPNVQAQPTGVQSTRPAVVQNSVSTQNVTSSPQSAVRLINVGGTQGQQQQLVIQRAPIQGSATQGVFVRALPGSNVVQFQSVNASSQVNTQVPGSSGSPAIRQHANPQIVSHVPVTGTPQIGGLTTLTIPQGVNLQSLQGLNLEQLKNIPGVNIVTAQRPVQPKLVSTPSTSLQNIAPIAGAARTVTTTGSVLTTAASSQVVTSSSQSNPMQTSQILYQQILAAQNKRTPSPVPTQNILNKAGRVSLSSGGSGSVTVITLPSATASGNVSITNVNSLVSKENGGQVPNTVNPVPSVHSGQTTSMTLGIPMGQQGQMTRLQTVSVTPQIQQTLQKIQEQLKKLHSNKNPTPEQSQLVQKLLGIRNQIIQHAKDNSATFPSAVSTPQTVMSSSDGLTDFLVSQAKILSENANAFVASGSTQATSIASSSAAGTVPPLLTQLKVGDVTLNINLTPQQRDKIQSQLARLTPEQQQLFYKHQQALMLKFHQQHMKQTAAAGQQGKQTILPGPKMPILPVQVGDTSTTIQIIRPAGSQLSRQPRPKQPNILPNSAANRGSIISRQLSKDQENVISPNCITAFANRLDACKRLLRYHVYQERKPSGKMIQKADDIFENMCSGLVDKSSRLFEKYRKLILDDSMREKPSSETVMIERLLHTDIKKLLEHEKNLAAENPVLFQEMANDYVKPISSDAEAVNTDTDTEVDVTTDSVPTVNSTNFPAAESMKSPVVKICSLESKMAEDALQSSVEEFQLDVVRSASPRIRIKIKPPVENISDDEFDDARTASDKDEDDEELDTENYGKRMRYEMSEDTFKNTIPKLKLKALINSKAGRSISPVPKLKISLKKDNRNADSPQSIYSVESEEIIPKLKVRYDAKELDERTSEYCDSSPDASHLSRLKSETSAAVHCLAEYENIDEDSSNSYFTDLTSTCSDVLNKNPLSVDNRSNLPVYSDISDAESSDSSSDSSCDTMDQSDALNQTGNLTQFQNEIEGDDTYSYDQNIVPFENTYAEMQQSGFADTDFVDQDSRESIGFSQADDVPDFARQISSGFNNLSRVLSNDSKGMAWSNDGSENNELYDEQDTGQEEEVESAIQSILGFPGNETAPAVYPDSYTVQGIQQGNDDNYETDNVEENINMTPQSEGEEEQEDTDADLDAAVQSILM